MLAHADLLALQNGEHPDPYAVLGMHEVQGQVWVHAFLPDVERADLIDRSTDQRVGELLREPDTDVFSLGLAPDKKPFDYRFDVLWKHEPAGSPLHPLYDPCAFGLVLGEMDVWLLSEGTHQRPFECLGAHPRTLHGVEGVSFAVWAPTAARVSVVGSFNQWDGRRLPMR